ncbi:MAG: chlorite dismutase family protein [Nitrospira sp.]|nr:chlorite dismutase family protein [Nitrospira sp.]MDH4368612.1 chlorite dismutase family protein [Nitrospira sp.]MDH5346684.1 chlorite dismutase family protein [Nitrospira sp.]MDH5496451.1 chlorite dismutase family protein [Nitrospira sp.]MDH5724805.1 chlorite dismutase family protein [Nitrospira sp.]
MMPRFHTIALLLLWVLIGSWISSVHAGGDREKLLAEPGIYGTFAVFGLDDEWGRVEPSARIARLATLKGVVEQHREHVAIDVYLLRGLSDQADLMFRIHATELRDIQEFLLDLQSSLFGKHLKTAGIMHGLTKKPNYVPGFSDQLKADLKSPSEAGEKPYVIVIPIKKSAEWWGLDQEKRTALMQEHTAVALPFLTTIKRKLYHSSGLDDVDFITYFETSSLEDFHNLVLALEKVKEFHYTRQFGNPTLLGTVQSLDEIIETLAQ